ncbi:TatC Sec-independent protein secretion pathway component TatC [actinobacterium SCGC AAA044-D11]
MPLIGHLNELRKRLFRSALAITAASFLGWFFYDTIINNLAAPICDLQKATSSGLDECGVLYINGVLGPIDLKFKISIIIGTLIASPIWLYQIWAFISPGLHKKERRNSILFVIFAVPFFAVGVFAGYLVLPIAVDVLLSFTPSTLSNLVKFDDYLGFVSQLIFVFGFAFELPVFLVSLNLAGILSGRGILKPWRYAIFGITLFSAIFTPAGDPVTMFFLAVPLWLLYLAAGGISLLVDRRRRRKQELHAD